MPTQISVLIDANIFIYHLGGVSSDCSEFLLRVALGEVEAYVTTVVIGEMLHRRMIGEAVSKKLVTSKQALKRLKANPKIVSALTDYIVDIETILELPLKVINATSADIRVSHPLRRAYGLLVNDSINFACAQRIGLTHIATHDDDFNRLPSVTVWNPTDI